MGYWHSLSWHYSNIWCNLLLQTTRYITSTVILSTVTQLPMTVDQHSWVPRISAPPPPPLPWLERFSNPLLDKDAWACHWSMVTLLSHPKGWSGCAWSDCKLYLSCSHPFDRNLKVTSHSWATSGQTRTSIPSLHWQHTGLPRVINLVLLNWKLESSPSTISLGITPGWTWWKQSFIYWIAQRWHIKYVQHECRINMYIHNLLTSNRSAISLLTMPKIMTQPCENYQTCLPSVGSNFTLWIDALCASRTFSTSVWAILSINTWMWNLCPLLRPGWIVDPTIVIDKDIYIEALQQDLVTLGHNIVCLIHVSSLCRKAFNNTIITGN